MTSKSSEFQAKRKNRQDVANHKKFHGLPGLSVEEKLSDNRYKLTTKEILNQTSPKNLN